MPVHESGWRAGLYSRKDEMKHRTLWFFAVVLRLVGSASLYAQSIPLANPTFEIPTVAVGAKTTGGIPGWPILYPLRQCLSQGTSTDQGVAHPLSTQLAPPSDGSQVGYFQLCGGFTVNNSQTTPAYYSPNTTYTFTVDFYRDAGAVSPIEITLLFCYAIPGGPACSGGKSVVATSVGTLSASKFISTTDSFVSRPIVVEINAGAGQGQATNLYFDNARLEATPLVAHTQGIVGIFAHRPGVTSRLNVLCNPASPPCALALEFHDIHGVLVSQKQVTVRPSETTSLDQPVSRDFMPDGGELVPRWFLKSGIGDVSFEIFDSSTGRTDLFVNWGGGSAPKTGNLNSGPVAITPLDTVRVKAYCDGSAPTGEAAVKTQCTAILGFADAASGRMLKQSRMVIEPGTGGYLDLHYEDTPQTMPRQEVIPQLTITGGNGIGGFAVLDRATGGTITQSFPAAAAVVGHGGGEEN
jgi:hypothetical protein